MSPAKKNKIISPVNDTNTPVVNKPVDKIASDPPILFDKIASVEQKETALKTAGVTRELVYRGIFDGLKAVKKTEKLVDGELITIEEPDETVRLKNRELALKAFGDLKEFQVTGSVTHNKVVYQWLNINTPPATRVSDVE